VSQTSNLNNIPHILDFEASCLSISSQIHHWVIKPKSEKIDLSLTCRAIHGMKRSNLIEKIGSQNVYNKMNHALQDSMWFITIILVRN